MTARRRLVRFSPLLLAQSLPRKGFFGSALFAWLHVEAVLLDFLDDIFLLHLALETTQCIFQRFAFLDNDFSHFTFTPNPVRIGYVRCDCLVRTPPLVIIAWQPPRGHAHRVQLRALTEPSANHGRLVNLRTIGPCGLTLMR